MATLVPVHALTPSLLGRSLAEVQQDLNRMWDSGPAGWTPAVARRRQISIGAGTAPRTIPPTVADEEG